MKVRDSRGSDVPGWIVSKIFFFGFSCERGVASRQVFKTLMGHNQACQPEYKE